MNNLRQICAGFILTLALTVSAFAGQIECGVVNDPPLQETAAAGEMQNGIQSTDTVTELVISLLTNLLPLF
jgi:hypothetical protein